MTPAEGGPKAAGPVAAGGREESALGAEGWELLKE